MADLLSPVPFAQPQPPVPNDIPDTPRPSQPIPAQQAPGRVPASWTGGIPQMPSRPSQPSQQPQPQPWRSPFTPFRARGWQNWGDDHWAISGAENYPGPDAGPMMPSPLEALRVIGGAGSQLRQWGSPRVGMFSGRASQIAMQLAPYLDSISKGAFSKNYLAARTGMLRAMQEEMEMNAFQAVTESRKQLGAFKEIIAQFEYGGINAEQMRDQIRDLAMQTGHQNIINMLDNGGPGAVMKYLDWEDAKTLDLYAGATSSAKAKKAATGDTSVLEGGGQGEGSDGGMPNRPYPYQKVPDPAISGTGPVKPGEPVDIGASIENIRKHSGLSADGMGIVRKMLHGEDVGLQSRFDKPTQGKLRDAEAAMEKLITDTAQGPGSVEDRLRKINDIDAPTGVDLAGLRNYTSDPKNTEIKNRGRLLRWAHMLGNYDEAMFDVAKKYKDLGRPEGRVMTRANSLAGAAEQAIRFTNQMKEDEAIPLRWFDDGYTLHFSGDPKYAALYQSLQNFATETIAVQTGTGTPRVQLVKTMTDHLKPYMSPAQIRIQLQIDAGNAYQFVRSYDQEWKAESKSDEHIPGFLNSADQSIDAIVRMNPWTGQMPPDAPERLLEIGKSGKERSPSWVQDWQKYAPLRQNEIHERRAFIQQHADDPDPKVQAMIAKLQKQLSVYRFDY